MAVALAAISLLVPWALAFDPLAWLVWGRDAGRLALDTTTGPSWKPFPVLFTTLLTPAGSAVAPALWLVVARAGGLLALAGAFVLGARLAGRWAGLAGAAVVALSPWWLFNTALGNSEGLLAAAVLWAVNAHLAGHARTALGFATAAALMRPEAWPFVAVYGAWLWRESPSDRRAVLLAGGVIPLLWFGPDVIGAGGALGASYTARGVPSPGSAKLESIPALAVLRDVATVLTLPALIAALVAAVAGGALARRIAAGAAAWIAIVVLMTVAGYAGNPRYLVAAAAVGAAVSGAGAVRAATALAAAAAARRELRAPALPDWSPSRRATGSLAAPFGAAVLVAAVLAVTAGSLRDQTRELTSRIDAARTFDGAVAAAGGRDALVLCSRVRTSARARSLVAWRLDLPMGGLAVTPERPAVVIRAKWFYGEGLEPSRAPGYRMLVTTPYWEIAAACGRAP